MRQDPPSKEPDDTREYISIADRIQQDVWHDNFVPKYSALATAEPSWLFIVGIWLLFSPQIFFTAMALVHGRRNNVTDIVMDVAFLLYSLLLVTILLVQTRRFISTRRSRVNQDIAVEQESD